MKLDSTKSVAFTPYAESLCFITNSYMKNNPKSSIAEMARFVREKCGIELSEVSIRRYYYGIHHYNVYPKSYSQVRFGACCPI